MRAGEQTQEARRRMEEAVTLYRFKARLAQEEFGELAWQWTDNRGMQFGLSHMQPQQEVLEQGATACRELGSMAEAAAAHAEEAERALRAVYAEVEAFDDAAAAARTAIGAAESLAHQVRGAVSTARSDISSLMGRISSATIDPGW